VSVGWSSPAAAEVKTWGAQSRQANNLEIVVSTMVNSKLHRTSSLVNTHD
jgi:hypothetical protein